jgi:hypothetical protein
VLKRLTLKQPRKNVYPNLWPPLELVEAALESPLALSYAAKDSHVGMAQPEAGSAEQLHIADLLLPLTELVNRRKAVKDHAFGDEWLAGRLVQIDCDGLIFGVLLDHPIQSGQWTGWLAACETSWAGDFDVLLEPEDDPFEPMFGVIQTWNPVTVEKSADIHATVVGAVNAARLEAIRAVAHENAQDLKLTIPVEPGRIALRTAGDQYSVLTGTPLADDDDRWAYQNAYRACAARLMAHQLTRRLASTRKTAAKPLVGFQRVKQWFSTAGLPRPVFAAACVCLVAYLGVSSVGLDNTGADDGVKFRSAPSEPAAAQSMRVKIKANASASEVEKLMQTAACEVVSGPDQQGVYQLKLDNLSQCSRVLGASDLVVQLEP